MTQYHFPTIIRSAWRHLSTNRLYHFINISGLAIAFTVLLLAIAYVHYESTFESFHTNADRIFRATYRVDGQNDFNIHFARVPVDFVNNLPDEIPEIEQLVRFQNHDQKYYLIGHKRFKAEHAYTTDAAVFDMFSFEFVSGNPANALTKPNSIVLTQSTAEKYFSGGTAIGKIISVTDSWSTTPVDYKVTAIIADPAGNSHLPIQSLMSFPDAESRTGWAYIYIMLSPETTIASVESKMGAFLENYTDSEAPNQISIPYQGLSDIHLGSDLARELKFGGNILYVRAILAIGILVWIIAMINFSNMGSALTLRRTKELGVRKVLGASTRELLSNTFTESLLYNTCAMIVACCAIYLLWPSFQNLTNVTHLPSSLLMIGAVITIVTTSAILTTIAPALIVKSFKLVDLFAINRNWSLRSKTGGLTLKQVMIGFQFCVTIAIAASALMARQQIQFIQQKNLGLSANQILALPEVPNAVISDYATFKSRLKGIPEISEIAACMQLPSSAIRDVGPVLVQGSNDRPEDAPMMDAQIVDPDFIQMMNIELVAGIDPTASMTLREVPEFTEEFTAQEYLAASPRQYLINETAMHQLGWTNPEEALGQQINWSIGQFELAFGPITGVIKDYHQESLRNSIDPMIMVVEPLWLGNILLRVNSTDISATVSRVQSVWNEMFPYAMEYTFLDESYNKLYLADRVQLRLLTILAAIAVFLSFMGLISVTAFALKARSKELSIRRVVGANQLSLSILVGKEYAILIGLCALLALPMYYYAIGQWLQNFAYHVDVSVLPVITTVISIYVIMLLTIFLQTFKSTHDNPITNLTRE